MIRRFVGTTLLGLAALSCESLPTEVPGPPAFPEAGGLRLDGSISSPVIPVGQTQTLAFRLRNLTAQPMTMTFGSTCQVTLFIQTRTGQEVYPGGGAYVCGTAITHLTIEPGGESLRIMHLYGGPGDPADLSAGLPILRGRYRAYATLQGNSTGVELRSESVEFEVR